MAFSGDLKTSLFYIRNIPMNVISFQPKGLTEPKYGRINFKITEQFEFQL